MIAAVRTTQITSQASTSGKPKTSGSTVLTKAVPTSIARNGRTASHFTQVIEASGDAGSPRSIAFVSAREAYSLVGASAKRHFAALTIRRRRLDSPADH